MKPWYDISFVQIAFGAVLGFCFSFFPQLIEKSKKNLALRVALKAELGEMLKYRQDKIGEIEECVQGLKEGRKSDLFFKTEIEPDITFYRNMTSYAFLKRELLDQLVRIFHEIRTAQIIMAGVQQLYAKDDDFLKQESERQTVIRMLERVKEGYREFVVRLQEIIAKL
ncbi:MAG: hypothetical protein AB1439_00550 [candidate division FCPU426 bacterium]